MKENQFFPRVFLSGSYQIETNPQKTIETFLRSSF